MKTFNQIKPYIFVVLLVVTSFKSLSAQQNRNENWLEGVWEGKGIQTDGQSWMMRLTISGERYVIEYPSLGCQGVWILVDRSSKKAKFVEKITSYSKNCVETGNVLIEKVSDKQIKFSYSLLNTKEVLATAILQKSGTEQILDTKRDSIENSFSKPEPTVTGRRQPQSRVSSSERESDSENQYDKKAEQLKREAELKRQQDREAEIKRQEEINLAKKNEIDNTIISQEQTQSVTSKNSAQTVIKKSANPKNNNCDLLAGHPEDKGRVGKGVPDGKIIAVTAIQQCALAIKQNPDEARFYFQLGRAYWKAKKYDDALDAFLKAEEMKYSPAYFYLGQAYEKGLIAGEKADTATAKNLYIIAASEEFEPAVQAFQELAGSEPDFSEFENPKLIEAIYNNDLKTIENNLKEAMPYMRGMNDFIVSSSSEFDSTCTKIADQSLEAMLLKLTFVHTLDLSPNVTQAQVATMAITRLFDFQFHYNIDVANQNRSKGEGDMYLFVYDYGACEGKAVKKLYENIQKITKEKYDKAINK